MVALTVLIALLYARGVLVAWRHAGRARGIRVWQVVGFALAIMLLLVVSVNPVHELSEQSFGVHMAQHVVLATVAPPLLVLGAPQLAIAWALPRPLRLRVVRTMQFSRSVEALWRWFTGPTVATVVHAIAIWAWHAPRLYTLALHSDVAHVAEHLSFVASAVLMWWSILHKGTKRSAYATGMIALFVTAMHTGALGAIITLSHTVLYPAQYATTGGWPASPIADQQVAGLIMWVVGGLVYVGQISALFVAWLRATSTSRSHADRAHLSVQRALHDAVGAES